MTTEPKGPFTESLNGTDARLLNNAHAAGFKDGRASRDRLRKELEKALEWSAIEIDGKRLDIEEIRQALAEDDKHE